MTPSTSVDGDDVHDGKIEAFMRAWLGRSWRPSLMGLFGTALAVVGAVAPMVPGVPAWVVESSRAVSAIAFGGGLVLAKGRTVTGNVK